MSTWGSWSNDFHRYSIPSCPLTTPSLCVRFGTPPLQVPPCPFTRGDVRSSISRPGAGDDMDNLVCEFCPALDMVLRLHAPLQVWHASDEGVNAGVEILNNFHRVLSLHSGRKTITLIKVRRDGGEHCWKCSDFPWSKSLQRINGAQRTNWRVFGVGKKFSSLLSCFFFTASLGFMVSAGEKNSRFKIITETWNKEIRDQDGRTPCQRSIGNVWGTLSSWPGNNLIQAERPSSEKLDFGRRSLDWLKEWSV